MDERENRPSYQFEYDANAFSRLEHVEWILDTKHIDEYEFHGSTVGIREKLFELVPQQTTFYSSAVGAYQEFCSAFDNNPYNYMTGILDRKEDYISSDRTENYLVRWKVEGLDGVKEYIAPIGYLTESVEGLGRDQLRSELQRMLNGGRDACLQVVSEIREKSIQAWKNIQSYCGTFEMAAPVYSKQLRTDFFWLGVAWVFLVFSLFWHPWFQKIVDAVSDFSGIGLFLDQILKNAGGLYVVGSGIVLAILAVCLLRQTIYFLRKRTVLALMKQVAAYAVRLKELMEVELSVEQRLCAPLGRVLVRDCRTPELRELSELAEHPVDLEKKFLAGLEPQNFPQYHCTLWKKAVWIIVFDMIALIVVSVA
ncbi:MAG: hypothetical protein LUI87_02745 [Lachnospiraceae bacterium]|nr:hypothetical protein [Lachnospiraceae bacterium]